LSDRVFSFKECNLATGFCSRSGSWKTSGSPTHDCYIIFHGLYC